MAGSLVKWALLWNEVAYKILIKKPSIFNPLGKLESSHKHLKCINIIEIYFSGMAFCRCSNIIYNAQKCPLC